MPVRRALPSDRPEWLRLRELLWPGQTAEHAREVDAFFQSSDPALAAFVVDRGDGRLGGFLEASTRSHADGCATSPVAYIEGWYVDKDLRRQAFGRALVAEAESWARNLGMAEIASDAEIENEVSISAHRALGYRESGRVVCFHRRLGAT